MVAGGADSDGYGAGLIAGDHAGVGDALARLTVHDDPDGVLSVGPGLEDGAWLGVVGGLGREARLPPVHPLLFAARGEEAERFTGREGDLDAAGEPPLRAGHGCSWSLCASAAVKVRPYTALS